MLIPLRDVRTGEAIVSDLFAPALAADDAADTLDVDRLPSRVVAPLAGHPGILSVRARGISTSES